MRVVIALYILVAGMHFADGEETKKLVPTKTYALIVGVLDWEQNSLAKYPAARRQDVALHEQLQSLGVPNENMVLLLDQAATRKAIHRAVTSQAKRASEASTLIVYYAGHGIKSGDEGVFASYDVRTERLKQTGWRQKILTRKIKKHFRGDHVLLFADCCFSGTLESVAKALSESGIQAASLTSATTANTSTNNWTFTQSLIAAFKGHPLADANADGVITLGETAADISIAMRHFEKQSSGFSTYKLSPDFQLAATGSNQTRPILGDNQGPHDFAFGHCVAARIKGKWNPARVLKCRTNDSGETLWLVQRQTYNKRPTAWVDANSIRPVDHRLPKDERPERLSEGEAQLKACLNGRLTKLLKRINVQADWRTYGAFHDYGEWSHNQYAGYENLPSGHWVYVYPHWYIWSSP